MNNPDLKKTKMEELAYLSVDLPQYHKAWVMDPPPWLNISELTRINIYKQQLTYVVKKLELQIENLRTEIEMVNLTLKTLG